MKHYMTLAAFPRKAELGGGYRGVVREETTGTRHESPVLTTLYEARTWAKRRAHELAAGIPYRLAHYSGYKGEYRSNLWINA